MKRLSVALMLFIILFNLPFPPETQNNPVQVQNPIFSIFLPVIQVKSPRTVFPLDQWTSVGDGIEFQQFPLPDPNNVYVARMDRENPNVFLESSIGSGDLVKGRETVSAMAQRYDEAINHWNNTWGGRNHVVVAINGDYFDPSTGFPQNGMLQSGWYFKTVQ